MEYCVTHRGFDLYQSVDRNGIEYTIQKSSLATDNYIWLGIDDINPQILATDAYKFGIDTTKTTGWIDYPIPNEVLMSSRMHLSRDDVRKMLPILNKFVETGNII